MSIVYLRDIEIKIVSCARRIHFPKTFIHVYFHICSYAEITQSRLIVHVCLLGRLKYNLNDTSITARNYLALNCSILDLELKVTTQSLNAVTSTMSLFLRKTRISLFFYSLFIWNQTSNIKNR